MSSDIPSVGRFSSVQNPRRDWRWFKSQLHGPLCRKLSVRRCLFLIIGLQSRIFLVGCEAFELESVLQIFGNHLHGLTLPLMFFDQQNVCWQANFSCGKRGLSDRLALFR